MNKRESDILNVLLLEPFINQRYLAEKSGHSLGVVNKSLKELIKRGYLDDEIRPTEKALNELQEKAPKNAIILAAGFAMRMVPINTEVPKGLIEVHGEPLVERLINQLHEVGIQDISIVVGFMKEKYDYLIDKYGVNLVVNSEYSRKNNLHSVKKVLSKLSNTYIIPCDIWCDRNPFRRNELYSWYMVSDIIDNESCVRVNRKMELVRVSEKSAGNSMVGIAYLTEYEASLVRNKIIELSSNPIYDSYSWEESLYLQEKMIAKARVVHSTDVVEINTLEQLREIDEDSNQLKSDALKIISDVLNVKQEKIVDITVLKKGMTNRSFLFTVNKNKYIMRIPGEGTDQLIDREKESNVYNAISKKGICDDIVYINPKNGYKITRYLDEARVCDSKNEEDIKICMDKLREFHNMSLFVDNEFDIFDQIEFYESLWGEKESIYRDYEQTKNNIFMLKQYIDSLQINKALTHIDAVPDNFLIIGNEVRLIDWEYAGMQDPHVDIAMFCIYSLYDKSQIDKLIDIYFEGNCTIENRLKIYCYIAACGLLWSNWCEYKRNLGIEFGEYSLRQYRYAKDYYKIVTKVFSEKGDFSFV